MSSNDIKLSPNSDSKAAKQQISPSTSSLLTTSTVAVSMHDIINNKAAAERAAVLQQDNNKRIIEISIDDEDDSSRNTNIDSGERQWIRWGRQNRRRLMKCGACLLVFVVFTAVMLTVGLTWIAELALNSFYPAQFNITRYPLRSVQLGPIDGNDVHVRFRVPVPPGLPVSVSLISPVEISLFICPPHVFDDAVIANNDNSTAATGDPIEGVRTGSGTLDCPEDQLMLIGVARAVGDRIDIPSSGEAEMNLILTVDDSTTTTTTTTNDINPFDHLVNSLLSSAKPLITQFLVDNNDTAIPTTNETLTSVDTAKFTQTPTNLTAGYERWLLMNTRKQPINDTTATNNNQSSTINWQSIDQTVLRVRMTLPCVQVLSLCIRNVRVDKTVLLQDKTLNYRDNINMSNVGGLFALISRGLVGDPELLQYTTKYLHLTNLQLYDASAGHPLPMELTALSAAEFQFFSPQSAPPAADNANSTIVLDNNSPVVVGVGRSSAAAMLLPATDNSDDQGIDIGADTGSLPFSIDVNFHNPSAVAIIGVKGLCINLNYSDQSVANITIPSVDIQAYGNSSFRVYGYVRTTVPERLLSTELANNLLNVMISQQFRPLPFTLTGCQLHSIPVYSNAAGNNPNNMAATAASRSVQAMLSRRVVNVGNQYPRLGPLSNPQDPESLAINDLFADIPVLGRNRLGDVLQGLQLHLGGSLISASIPVSIFLANPFNCSLAIKSFTIRVYLSTMTNTTIGTVTLRQPIHLSPGQSSGVFMNGTIIPLAQPQAVFQVDFGVLRQLRSTIKYLTTTNTSNPQPFVVSLAFDEIRIHVGRWHLLAHDLSQNMLRGIPLIPAWVMGRIGGMNGMMSLFTGGWNMIAPALSAYHNYTLPSSSSSSSSSSTGVLLNKTTDVDYERLLLETATTFTVVGTPTVLTRKF